MFPFDEDNSNLKKPMNAPVGINSVGAAGYTPAPDVVMPESVVPYNQTEEYKNILKRLEETKLDDNSEELKNAQQDRQKELGRSMMLQGAFDINKALGEQYGGKVVDNTDFMKTYKEKIDNSYKDKQDQFKLQADRKKEERAILVQKLDELRQGYNDGRIARNDKVAEEKFLRNQIRENKQDEQRFKEDALNIQTLQNKVKLGKMEVATEESLNQKDSDISKFARLKAKEELTRTGQDPKIVGDNATANQLKQMGLFGKNSMSEYQAISTAIREKELEIKERDSKTRVEKFLEQQEESNKKRFDSINKEAKNTEEYKSTAKSLVAVNKINKLLNDAEKEGGQSLSVLGPAIAKGIAGEVGVLTEQDVIRYVQNPAILGKYYDTFLKLRSGQLSGESAENIRRVLNIIEKDAKDQQKGIFDRYSRLLTESEAAYNRTGTAPIDQPKARELMGIQERAESRPVGTVRIMGPKGDIANVKKEVADKYLSRPGYRKVD